jgi:spermidine synthase
MQLHAIKDIVYSGKTRFQTIEIINTNSFGQCLVLDGKIQSSETDEFIYHEALTHPAMIAHAHPKTVFIAGGGEGATLREALSHPSIERVVMVDIDEEAVNICRRLLSFMSDGCFDDNRLELLHADARKYLDESEEKFDIIIIDLTEPLKDSPSYLLYTKEFYNLIQERLTPDGIISVQSGSCSLEEMSTFTAINSTLSSVFPLICPYKAYVPSFSGLWGFITASNKLSPYSLSAEEVDSRIADRSLSGLRFYDGITHQSMFSLPKYIRQRIAEDKRVITDNNPQFTY